MEKIQIITKTNNKISPFQLSPHEYSQLELCLVKLMRLVSMSKAYNNSFFKFIYRIRSLRLRTYVNWVLTPPSGLIICTMIHLGIATFTLSKYLPQYTFVINDHWILYTVSYTLYCFLVSVTISISYGRWVFSFYFVCIQPQFSFQITMSLLSVKEVSDVDLKLRQGILKSVQS